MDTKYIATGLFICVQNQGKPAVVVQQRAHTPTDPYFPNGCQATVHGGLLPEEIKLPDLQGFMQAILREAREELGNKISEEFKKALDASGGQFPLIRRIQTKEKEIFTFGIKLDLSFDEFIEKCIKSPQVKALRLITSTESIYPIIPEDHIYGGIPAEDIYMFQDDIEALSEALDIWQKLAN